MYGVRADNISVHSLTYGVNGAIVAVMAMMEMMEMVAMVDVIHRFDDSIHYCMLVTTNFCQKRIFFTPNKQGMK